MFYNLFLPLSVYISGLNVLRYISFRAIWALIFALLITIFVGPYFIKFLHKFKYGQQIHEDVTKHQAKAGTPTMGGLLIITSTVISTLLWANITNSYVWITLFCFVGFGFVGFLDDYLMIKHKKNKGLGAKQKMLGLTIVATVAMLFLILEPAYSTKLSVPFFKTVQPDLGWFYLPFAIVVMLAASNAVNLTDGLDGLAIMPSVFAVIVYGIFIYITGHAKFAEYLQVMPVSGVGEVSVFCAALIGAGIGFLWFNAYPAQIFMGDVGSLSLGGTIGFLAILCKQELLLIIVGGLFAVETLSVILQVGYFKMSGGKRIFRMAPLHHHFELKGIPESKIVIRFWIISLMLGLIALSVIKIR